MLSWLARSMGPLVGVCLVAALLATGAAAQSTMDPSIDSDGDGTNNQRDFDDDNDLVADDVDCDPFDPSIGRECPTPTIAAPAASQDPDNDGDGIIDRLDPDDDNDGIVDERDSAPFDPSVGQAPTPSTIDQGVDNDGDGIENRQDPDDDNDGVVDEHDSHPFDPSRGEQPTPSAIDPRTDSDGDGIANSVDPDDDNDGVVDEIDCAPFDASVTDCPKPVAPGTGGNADGGSGDSGGGGAGVPLVTSLPVTGTAGPEPVVHLGPVAAVVAIVAGATLLLAGLSGWLRPIRVPVRTDRRR